MADVPDSGHLLTFDECQVCRDRLVEQAGALGAQLHLQRDADALVVAKQRIRLLDAFLAGFGELLFAGVAVDFSAADQQQDRHLGGQRVGQVIEVEPTYIMLVARQ